MWDDVGWVNDEVNKDVVYECERDGVGRTEKGDGCGWDENKVEGEFECIDGGEGAAIGLKSYECLDEMQGGRPTRPCFRQKVEN